MKAQARKILALIMAMVMCLSLAAPAFAASEEAAEAEASAPVVETEAPEAEDDAEDGELAAQAVTTVISITENPVDSGKITVETDDGTTTYNLSSDTLPAWIDCKLTSKAHVGENKGAATYRVSVASGYTDNTAGAITVTVPGDATEKVKLLNTAEWSALEGAAVYFGDSEVKGYSWQEVQDNGKYRVFFKLAKVENKAFKTGDDDWKYFVAAGPYDKLDASSMNTALAVALEWNTDTETATAKAITDAGVTLPTTAAAVTNYSYTVINASDVTVTDTPATVNVTAFATDKETGSFQVSVKATTGTEESFLSSAADVEKLVKKELAASCEVESVVAATGNYFTVTVKKNAKSADAISDAADKVHKGVIYWNNGAKNIAGLYDIDAEKGGFYNADDTNGANGVQIAKGTELLGPVAVKASDVPNGAGKTFQLIPGANLNAANPYYIFNTVEEMKAAIKLSSCASNKTVSYVQLVMNKKKGTKVNGLVNDPASVATVADAVNNNDDPLANYLVTPVNDDWCTANSIAVGNNKEFVKKDSWTVEANAHGAQKTVTEVTKAATCQEEGIQTTKTVCTVCGTVLSSTEKAIAKISDPIEINKTQVLPEGETDPTKTVDKVYFEDTDPHSSSHYINKFEVKTTTDGTVTTKTTTYTCNYGFVHDELTKVETIKKSDLQGSGKWNLVNWKPDYTIQNQNPWNAAGTNMFGYTVEVTDSDIDDATLPLNRTAPADPIFSFGTDATATALNDMGDGTFTAVVYKSEDVYANNSSLPKTKNYAAVGVVKNISYPKYVCVTGTATLEVSIYELTDKWTAADSIDDGTGKLDSKKLEKAIEDKKVTLLPTYTKDVVIPAAQPHVYTAGATVCDRCGTSREAAQSKSQIFTADTVEVSDLDWTGVAAMPKVVVKDTEGNMLIEDVDYITGVEDKNATDVGTYTCVIKGTGDYTGNRISKTYNINKVAATLKKKSAPKTLTASATKKVTGQIKMTVKGGKVSAYKVTGKVAGVSVNKSGKITVKKGNKKAGTLKVKVSMKADKNHTAAKAVTVKVAIKAAPAAKKTTKKK